MVGVAGDAGDDIGIAVLHSAGRAPQRDHAAGAAEGQMIQPARAEAEMLRQSDSRIGKQREARDAEAVDLILLQPG